MNDRNRAAQALANSQRAATTLLNILYDFVRDLFKRKQLHVPFLSIKSFLEVEDGPFGNPEVLLDASVGFAQLWKKGPEAKSKETIRQEILEKARRIDELLQMLCSSELIACMLACRQSTLKKFEESRNKALQDELAKFQTQLQCKIDLFDYDQLGSLLDGSATVDSVPSHPWDDSYVVKKFLNGKLFNPSSSINFNLLRALMLLELVKVKCSGIAHLQSQADIPEIVGITAVETQRVVTLSIFIDVDDERYGHILWERGKGASFVQTGKWFCQVAHSKLYAFFDLRKKIVFETLAIDQNLFSLSSNIMNRCLEISRHAIIVQSETPPSLDGKLIRNAQSCEIAVWRKTFQL